MKAIIETGGKQQYVSVGDIIYVEKLDVEPNKKVIFDKVLLVDDVVGNPFVEGVVLKHGKKKKITIFKYKQKKRSNRKKQGHRQPYTKVEIKNISK